MIRVGARYVCLFEHIDGQLGGKVVRAVVPGSGTVPTFLVFEDGYCLPLLCPCCGRPLETTAGAGGVDDFVGGRLVGLEYLPKKGDQAERVAYVFALAAGRRRRAGSLGPDEDLGLILHVNSGRQIYRLPVDVLPPAGRPAAGRRPKRKKKR